MPPPRRLMPMQKRLHPYKNVTPGMTKKLGHGRSICLRPCPMR
jgi:hypothetical protein